MRRLSRVHFVYPTLVCVLVLYLGPAALGQAKKSETKSNQPERKASPCPQIIVPAAARLSTGAIKEGQVVASGLLDTRPAWTNCAMPSYPSGKRVVARIALEIDEDGKVVKVKPRGKQEFPEFYEVVAEAARSWRVSPPRARGVQVKTELQLDLIYR